MNLRPALSYTGLRLSNVVLGRALYLNNGAGWLDVNKTVLLENAVMKACDTLDGVVDGIISNVAACKLQAPAVLAALRCPAGKNDANQWVTGDQWVKFITRIPTFNSLTFDPLNPGTYQAQIQQVSAEAMRPTPTSQRLSRRAAKRSSLTVSPMKSSARIRRSTTTTRSCRSSVRLPLSFVRFYLMPGVGHGTGPFLPQVDSLGALEQGVKNDTTPETLTVTDSTAATAVRTRPLCRYPTWPKYTGGDVNFSSEFQL